MQRARGRASAWSVVSFLILLFTTALASVAISTSPVAALRTEHRAPPAVSTSAATAAAAYDVAVRGEAVRIEHTPPPRPDGTLLVSTLDGTLHALDLRSGEYLWSFGAGSSLLHASDANNADDTLDEDADSNDGEDTNSARHRQAQAALLTAHEQLEQQLHADLDASGDLIFDQDEEVHAGHSHTHGHSHERALRDRADGPVHAQSSRNGSTSPLMIPGVDGSLFYSGTHGLQRLPISVAELVEAAPFKTGDNTRYLGFKETNVFLIHRNTGQLQRVFSPQHTHSFAGLQEGCDAGECDPNLIWVGKTDLTVHALDGRSGKLRWNVSISTYAPFESTDGSVPELSEAELEALGYPEIGVSVAGTVHALDITQQKVLWSQPLQSPITSVFLLRPDQILSAGADQTDPDINVNLSGGDMIKLPHFYFDVDPATDSDPISAMMAHYHRSRDLASVTTFTYIGQTASGLIYALPNPQPLEVSPRRHPFFVDGTTGVSGSSSSSNTNGRNRITISGQPHKPYAGASTIPAIGFGDPTAPTDYVDDDNIDAQCIPTSASYPRCLVGFHALSVGTGGSGMSSTQQQRIGDSSAFYNQSVKPLPPSPPVTATDLDDSDALVDGHELVSLHDAMGVTLPHRHGHGRPHGRQPGPIALPLPPGYPPAMDTLAFWWPVLVISVVLCIVVSITMWTLQRISERGRARARRNSNSTSNSTADESTTNGSSNGGAKKGKRHNKKKSAAVAEADDADNEDPNDTVAPSSMRKRGKKNGGGSSNNVTSPAPLPVQRQNSDSTGMPTSSPPTPLTNKLLGLTATGGTPTTSGTTTIVRKSHFGTYEDKPDVSSPMMAVAAAYPNGTHSATNSIGSSTVSTGSQSGDTKTMPRPRKHIQTRPDPAQLNSDAATSLAAPDPTTFSTPRTNPDGSVAVGAMVYYPHRVLGTGSMGTVVYSGTFGGRPCAIKRLVKPFFGSANATQEIALLIQSDQHPNVLRYYAKEEDASFIYLALEQCAGTIQDLVDKSHLFGKDPAAQFENTKAILYGMMTGLAHLHSLHIVHRDIKPANLLLASSALASSTPSTASFTAAALSSMCKLADMGLGKQLSLSRSSFDSVVSGSIGWQAPEVLNANGGRLTKAVDVFSAGLVMHFILTRGQHPYGENMERELNILHNRMDLSGLLLQPEARDLIGCMLHPDPALRMSAEDACAHPFFWSAAKQLDFLLEASDRFEAEPEHSELRMCLEAQAAAVVGENWSSVLDEKLIDNLGKYRKYDFASVRDCLRVIRNKKNHYRDLPLDVRQALGEVPDGFLAYFKTRFPALLIYIYSVLACFALESPASSRGDTVSWSPLDRIEMPQGVASGHAPASSSSSPSFSPAAATSTSAPSNFDTDLRLETLQSWYHKPLCQYPELRFASPAFHQFYALISLRRLVQLQKHTRLRFRHWYVDQEQWIDAKNGTQPANTNTDASSSPELEWPTG